ncbi:MAG: protein translocase SEC61 complex subunit gamma [Promethearchaeota archaeon]
MIFQSGDSSTTLWGTKSMEDIIASVSFLVIIGLLLAWIILKDPVRIKDFFSNLKRIIQIVRKPGRKEVELIARVSGIGILIIGGVGYLIQILGNLVNEFFKPKPQESTGGSQGAPQLALSLILLSTTIHNLIINFPFQGISLVKILICLI